MEAKLPKIESGKFAVFFAEKATAGDRAAAENAIRDMLNALNGR
jgi:hypothetical protein